MPEPQPSQPARPAAERPSRKRPSGLWKLAVGAGVLGVLVVVALVAFGSSSSPLTDPIARAAVLSSSTPGYQMRMAVQVSSPSLSAPITASGSGTVDLRDHATSMSLVIDLNEPQVAQLLGSSTLQMDLITEGTTVYMRLPAALSAQLSAGGKPWLKLDVSKLSGVSGLSSLGSDPVTSDPSHILDYLRGISSAVAAEGRQVVDGVPTSHYRAAVSLDRIVNALPSADGAAMQQALSKLEQLVPGDIPLDVWIDAHHLVRRMAMAISISLPTGQSMDEAVTVDLSHYGPQTRPAAPPSGQVEDFSGLLSGSGL